MSWDPGRDNPVSVQNEAINAQYKAEQKNKAKQKMLSDFELLGVYQRGDRLTDDELVRLRDGMQRIADATSGWGERFILQYVYAQQVADNCDLFLRSRAENKK